MTISFLTYQLYLNQSSAKQVKKLLPFTLLQLNQNAEFEIPFQYLGSSQKYMLINFWASWCTVCEKEFEVFDEIHNKYSRTIEIIRVATSDNLHAIQKSNKLKKISGTVLLDVDGQFANLMKVKGVPQTFLIAPNGDIMQVYGGAMTQTQITDMLKFVEGP